MQPVRALFSASDSWISYPHGLWQLNDRIGSHNLEPLVAFRLLPTRLRSCGEYLAIRLHGPSQLEKEHATLSFV